MILSKTIGIWSVAQTGSSFKTVYGIIQRSCLKVNQGTISKIYSIISTVYIAGVTSRLFFKHKKKCMDEMKTLASCLNKIVKDGYTQNFKVTEDGLQLQSLETEKLYHPDEVHIVNFFRFEGASDPSDSAILYVIEANDGARGSLTDAYGMYADTNIDKFIKEVENISK